MHQNYVPSLRVNKHNLLEPQKAWSPTSEQDIITSQLKGSNINDLSLYFASAEPLRRQISNTHFQNVTIQNRTPSISDPRTHHKSRQLLHAQNLPSPSFSTSTPLRTFLPSEIEASRQAVLEANDELTALLLGPVESLIPPVTSPNPP
jgi:hypothetical protein